MKITLEQYEEKITIETEDNGLIISEFIDHLYSLSVAAGYNPLSVADAMYQKGADMTESYDTGEGLYDE